MHRRSLAALALTLPPGRLQAQAPRPLTVFAAASLQEALRNLAASWAAAAPEHRPLRLAFAASSTLARQIEQGAPADLFLSADEPWMNYLQERRLIDAESRVSPIGNKLALVAPPGSTAEPSNLSQGSNLLTLLGAQGRLAMGDPAHVPVGAYAQAALTWLGQWRQLEPRLARAESAPAALLLVARGEAPLGIVYATDVPPGERVKVLGTFPAASHPPITYPFAVTARAAMEPQARRLLTWLAGPMAAGTWRDFGFAIRPR